MWTQHMRRLDLWLINRMFFLSELYYLKSCVGGGHLRFFTTCSDLESCKIFSETTYNCLKEQRAQRPNTNQILKKLEKALEHQMRRENLVHSIVVGEVEGASSDIWKGRNLKHLKIPLIDIVLATKNFTKDTLGHTHSKVYKAELESSIEEKCELPRNAVL